MKFFTGFKKGSKSTPIDKLTCSCLLFFVIQDESVSICLSVDFCSDLARCSPFKFRD